MPFIPGLKSAKARRDEPGATRHRMLYNHIGRRKRDVDAVCEFCGLEEVDITPAAKRKTTRFRWPGGVLLINKPACKDRANEASNAKR